MKKLILNFLAIILWVGFTYAQNNTASIIQTSNASKADVTQTGSTNSSTVLQNGGDNNRLGSPILGDPGINVGSEVDNLNLAKGLVQEGNNNTFGLTQTGNLNVVQQFRQLRGVYNSVYQHGNFNQFTIGQVGDGDVVGQAVYEYNSLEQVGDNNIASVNQSSGNSNRLSVFYQHGNSNSADIDQVGNNNNISVATQENLGVPTTTNNILTIYQNGNSNTISQAGEMGDNIHGSVNQLGNNNSAFMQLTHTNAYGDINQNGDHNTASVTINMSYVGNANSGTIHQTGDYNNAVELVSQVTPNVNSSNNTMSTTQDGDYNYSSIIVRGSNNLATISSTGSHNGISGVPILINQDGLNNASTITQNSDSNAASVIQTGNNNVGSVVQH